MPGHDIVRIDATIAANAGGTMHCLTMQIPAMSQLSEAAERMRVQALLDALEADIQGMLIDADGRARR